MTPLDCCETEPKTLDEGIFEEEEEEKVTADAMKFFSMYHWVDSLCDMIFCLLEKFGVGFRVLTMRLRESLTISRDGEINVRKTVNEP